MTNEAMIYSLPMLQTINNKPSTCGDQKPSGHFHVFPAELFPAISWNMNYCKPNEKTWPTWHLSVIQGQASGRVLGWLSEQTYR